MDRAVELEGRREAGAPKGMEAELPQCLARAASREIEPVVKVNADITIADGRHITATFGC